MTSRALFEALGDPSARAEGRVTLDGPAAHHLSRVCRARINDRVVLFDGRGAECDAVITALGPKTVTLAIEALRAGVTADRARVTLIQGVPKGDKLDAVVRQATELGVSAVWPVFTEHSVPKARADRGDARTERLTRIAEEAARQCNRADVPTVLDACGLREALARLAPPPFEGVRIVAWERATNGLMACVKPDLQGPCTLVVGPEGGLSEAEVVQCRIHGFYDVSLGPRILRTETAAIAAIAVLSLLRGDLGQW